MLGREKFRRVKPLADLDVKARGWTLDVLNGLRELQQHAIRPSTLTSQPSTSFTFTNEDAYTLEQKLSALHPDNKNVRPKIRQQLQVLRDLGLLNHARPGLWRFP